MATTTRIQPFGNALGVTLDKEALAKSGFAQNDAVHIEATPDRIVITRMNRNFVKAMEGFRKAAVRYPGTMAELAK
jgi:antitoxin component of MazEF toxin-antitoxin module